MKSVERPKGPGTFDGSERKRVNENRFETLFETKTARPCFSSRLALGSTEAVASARGKLLAGADFPQPHQLTSRLRRGVAATR